MLFYRMLVPAALSAILGFAHTIDATSNPPIDVAHGETDGANPSSTELTEEYILEAIEGARRFLQTEIPDNAGLLAKVNKLVERGQKLEKLHAQVEKKQQSVDRLVRLANVRQLENLLKRLNQTYEKESLLRSAQSTQNSGEQVVMAEEADDTKTIPISSLTQRFDIQEIMGESEAELKTWVIQIIEDELKDYKESLLRGIEDQQKCPSASDIAQNVQHALNEFSQDDIGLVDHAQGGDIVYSMTSSTYVPPPDPSNLLGNVWWRKFIPEDWEELLPEGWENWSVSIPPFIYHTLVRIIKLLLNDLLSFSLTFSSVGDSEPKGRKISPPGDNTPDEDPTRGLLAYGRKQGTSYFSSSLPCQSRYFFN